MRLADERGLFEITGSYFLNQLIRTWIWLCSRFPQSHWMQWNRKLLKYPKHFLTTPSNSRDRSSMISTTLPLLSASISPFPTSYIPATATLHRVLCPRMSVSRCPLKLESLPLPWQRSAQYSRKPWCLVGSSRLVFTQCRSLLVSSQALPSWAAGLIPNWSLDHQEGKC